MRYLITGGGGFIGSHLADTFVAPGGWVTTVEDLATDYCMTSAVSRAIRDDGEGFEDMTRRVPCLDRVRDFNAYEPRHDLDDASRSVEVEAHVGAPAA